MQYFRVVDSVAVNDLKTSERNKLGQLNLKHTMIWHIVAKQLSCEQVPVRAILKEFHELSGALENYHPYYHPNYHTLR